VTRIPVIYVDKSAICSGQIFDPNSWADCKSKGIIQSCWSEYSALFHCSDRIKHICGESNHLCQKHIDSIQENWRKKKFELQKIVIFSQSVDLHIHIEAFFSGIKTLLDLLVQLLSSEKIAKACIDGFHRDKDMYGGSVLNVLKNNALSSKKKIATRIHALITEHKRLWIDEAILARDQLIHPEKGAHQLMFQLEFTEQEGNLISERIIPPIIKSEPIDQYAKITLKNIREFACKFLGLLNT